MYKIDLHVHSTASPDGSINLEQIGKALNTNRLNYIAITDHDTIEYAIAAKKQYGDAIIVGEEISTSDGELIGLYLTEKVKPGMTATETAKAIRRQGGLVYVPHPFEIVRHGIQLNILEVIASQVDIVETINGRAWHGAKRHEGEIWAAKHAIAPSAASDAHGWCGWCKTYTLIEATPNRKMLPNLLNNAVLHYRRPGLRAISYPALNRLRGKRHA